VPPSWLTPALDAPCPTVATPAPAAYGNEAISEVVPLPQLTPIMPEFSTRPVAPPGVRMVVGAEKDSVTDVAFRHGRGLG
jgi:hypothetical protein